MSSYEKIMNNIYEINLYYVKSDFSYIVNSLVKKLKDKKVLINLSNELEMILLDKYLFYGYRYKKVLVYQIYNLIRYKKNSFYQKGNPCKNH